MRTKYRAYFLCLFLSLAASHATAQNLGNYGQVFSVLEEDLREHILNRLKAMSASGELKHAQDKVNERVASHVIRPKPLVLSTTNNPKRFHVNPSKTIAQDVFGAHGELIARAGTTINPFEHVNFKKTLFFFDGDDAKQVAWVGKHYKDFDEVKFILTGGDVRRATETFGRVYFDVNGVLSSALHLKNVPSVVKQDGLVWQITEIGSSDV
jgi:conjugal transfer pilus assembly protein TraW